MKDEEKWASLKNLRDELRLKSHLFNMEAKQKWSELDKELNKLNRKIDKGVNAAGEMSDEVWEGQKLIMEELKEGFQKIKRAIKS